jgi:hypothetical protein
MLKELLAANIDLHVDQGDTYYKTFTIRDNTGVAVNLTGLEFTATVKRYHNTGTEYPMTVNILNALTGSISVEMTADETSDLIHDRYVYSIRASDSNDTTKILFGQLMVVPL